MPDQVALATKLPVTLKPDHPLAAPIKRNRVLLRVLVVVGSLLAILIAAIAVLHLYQQAAQHTRVNTQNLARSINQTIEEMVAVLDSSLQSTADELSRQIATGPIDPTAATAYMVKQLERTTSLAYIRATNEYGDVIYGRGVLASPTNLSDRVYYIALQQDAGKNQLTHQFVIGRNTGKPAWVFARRINKADGSFGGVVIAGMLEEQFLKVFSKIRLSPGGSITLRDSDFKLIARYSLGTTNSLALGNQQLTKPYVAALDVNPDEGTYESGNASGDGISRLHAYQRSARFGFYVNVGATGEDHLVDWQHQSWMIIAFAATFMAALLVFARVLNKTWTMQEHELVIMDAAENALRLSEDRFHSLFDAMSEGVALHQMVYDEQGQPMDYLIIDVNPAFESHTNTSAVKVKGKLATLAYGTTEAPFLEQYARVARTRQAEQFEFYFAPMEKQFLINVVSPAADQFATIFEDITEQTAAKSQLESRLAEISRLQLRLQEQVVRDPLTDLHNRRFIDETLPRELSRAQRAGQPMTVIMLDIDHFKRVNDTYGHAAGDEVLKVLAKLLKSNARDSDVVCRYGGEEFLIALANMNVHQAVERVDAWCAQMRMITVRYGDFRISVTLSAGVAGFPEHGSDVDSLINRADEALYRSKANGRNCVTAWQE